MKSIKTTKTKTTCKAVAPKKVASKPAKVAVVTACAPKAPAKAKTATPVKAKKEPESKLTRIVAHVDVGWGRMLYIRGEGAGLSWEQGIPMICENDTEWHWLAETDNGPISFKFLIDDKIWSLGENISINAGDVHISEPRF